MADIRQRETPAMSQCIMQIRCPCFAFAFHSQHTRKIRNGIRKHFSRFAWIVKHFASRHNVTNRIIAANLKFSYSHPNRAVTIFFSNNTMYTQFQANMRYVCEQYLPIYLSMHMQACVDPECFVRGGPICFI